VNGGEPLIVVDAGIPDVQRQFEGLGIVLSLPAGEIDRSALRDAHAVVVRSITRVDARLLDGTPVRFVGTATSGTDHVDRGWLRKQGISFTHARGANAESVVDYVIAALLRLSAKSGTPLAGRTAGIVGCGNVGGRLAPRLRALGLEVLLRDPPKDRRARSAHGHSPYLSMDEILSGADLLTIHTPLIGHGRDRTHHLVDHDFLVGMREGAWLVNTSRGSVIDEAALLRSDQRPGALILDVWEGEPLPDPGIVALADVATAHIAGYALDSKLEATRRMARALARNLGRPVQGWSGDRDPAIEVALPDTRADGVAWLDRLVHRIYPLGRDDAALRAVVAGPEADRAGRFEALRHGYPVRRLFSRHGAREEEVPVELRRAVFDGLGLKRI